MRIMQINANCLSQSKRIESKNVLVREKPDVVCVQETFHTAADKAHYQGYQSFRWDRKSGKGGGLLTLVSDRYTAEEKKLVADGSPEFGVVKVTNTKDKAINIANYYNNRTGNFSKSQFRKILKETEHPKIIIGDFNLHHTLWNDSHTEDGKAKELIEILIDPDERIALATPKNLATRLNKTIGKTTTLDLTIVSSELAADLTVYSKDDFDSDHFIIFTDVEFGPQPSACETREKWSFSDKRIAKWKEEISKLNLPNLKTLPTEDAIKEVTEKMIEAGKKHLAIKGSQGLKKKTYNSTPGWTAKCEAIKKKEKRPKKSTKKKLEPGKYKHFCEQTKS